MPGLRAKHLICGHLLWRCASPFHNPITTLLGVRACRYAFLPPRAEAARIFDLSSSFNFRACPSRYLRNASTLLLASSYSPVSYRNLGHLDNVTLRPIFPLAIGFCLFSWARPSRHRDFDLFSHPRPSVVPIVLKYRETCSLSRLRSDFAGMRPDMVPTAPQLHRYASASVWAVRSAFPRDPSPSQSHFRQRKCQQAPLPMIA